ncbi:MAG: 23S rRNA (pseudouridine(1915)-N(3))-methyltransferase RlmH [Mariprofundaceae bacterium]
MKLRLIVVGRGASELSAFETEFLKRLKGQCSFEIVELPEGRGKQLSQRKQEEEKHILKIASSDFILFDEHGKSMTSVQWAGYLQSLHGGISLDFVIGGAAGVSDVVRQKAKACWSLSALTLPHKLARALVVEQLYRAFTIIQRHPYHRE